MGPFINDVAPYSCSACWTHFHALAGDGPRAQCGTDTYRLSHMAASIFPSQRGALPSIRQKKLKVQPQGPRGPHPADTQADAQAGEGSVVVQTGAKCRHATSFSPTLSPHAVAAAAPSGEAMWTAWRLLSAILRARSRKEGGVSCTDKVPLASYRRRTAYTK